MTLMCRIFPHRCMYVNTCHWQIEMEQKIKKNSKSRFIVIKKCAFGAIFLLLSVIMCNFARS